MCNVDGSQHAGSVKLRRRCSARRRSRHSAWRRRRPNAGNRLPSVRKVRLRTCTGLALTVAADLWASDAEYSQRDENGIPTHDKDGAPLNKSARKKLEKQFAAQQTLHDKYFKQ